MSAYKASPSMVQLASDLFDDCCVSNAEGMVGDYEAKSAILCAVIETTERAARLAAAVIVEARTGEIDTDLRSISHILQSRLRDGLHLDGKALT